MNKNTFKFIAPLFCENNSLSLGRISFWMIFAMCSWLWFTLPVGQDIPASMTQALYITFSYNLLKKGVEMWGSVRTSSTGQPGYSQNTSTTQFGVQNQVNRPPVFQPTQHLYGQPQQQGTTVIVQQNQPDDDMRSPRLQD